VSDAFLDRGENVSTRARDPEETQRFNARPGDLTKRKPMIVLINDGSASAAENRGRRPAGPPSRDADRHPLVRQGFGASHHPARAVAANRRAITGDIASWTAPSDSDTSGSTSRISGHKRGP
jgi:Peptidase family S41